MHGTAVGSRGLRVTVAVQALSAAMLAALMLPAAGNATPIAVGASITPSASATTLVPTQAGGHPNVTVRADFCGATVPCADQTSLKNLLINLPPGLIANPEATPTCPDSDLSQCETNHPESQVGAVTISVESGGVVGSDIPGSIYNLEPNAGELARFGVYVPSFPAQFQSQSVGFSLGASGAIVQEPVNLPQLAGVKVRSVDYTLYGIVGGEPFVYNPTSCGTQQGSVQANSYSDATLTTALADYTTNGCNLLPSLAPTTALTPDSTEAGQPSGYTLSIDTHFNAGADPIQSHIRSTEVVFPQGLTLSASAGGQLDSCSPAQLASSSCPANSIVGDISLDSPFVDHPITGHAYFGVPTDAVPYPVVFGFDSSSVGIQLQSSSHVDEQTGQITAITIDQPQLPFSQFQVHLRGGDYAVLANPNNCGSYHSTATFTAWSGQPDAVNDSPDFDIDQGFGQGCPQPRAFSPTLDASLSDTTARARTHLRTIINRSDNDQQLTGLKIQTPPGLTATLAEVPHCPRAAALSGDCGDASKIGDVTVLAGAGNTPIQQQGKMFLTDPINDGDVIGFSFVIEARAGPIDFGKVVTTSGVKLSTGGDTATTDTTAIPRIFKGIPVPIRKIDVDLNSDRFLINPSNCDPKQFKTDFFSDENSQHAAATPFQITGCERLPFAPRLTFSTNAKRQPKYNNQTWHPAIRAIVTQDGLGEAGIKSSRVAIPGILRPNITGVQKTLCQGATLRNCPVSSRVGEAAVDTPLLAQPLTGYMYLLQEPGKILPKIALALDGPVSVDVDSRNAIEGIRTVNYFENVPDVPIRKVDFLFYGGTGSNGILNAFSGLCTEKSYADADFTGHNGKKFVERPLLKVDGCPVVAKLSIKGRKLRVSKRGVVRLRIRCGSKKRCVGSASLTTGRAAKAAKRKTLGKGKVKIKPRRTGVVKVKLNKKALKRLRKRRSLRATVSIALDRQPVQTVGKVTLLF